MIKKNTYFDTLLLDKKFKEDFEREYKSLVNSQSRAAKKVQKRSKLDNLKKYDVIVGNSDDIVHFNWVDELKPQLTTPDADVNLDRILNPAKKESSYE